MTTVAKYLWHWIHVRAGDPEVHIWCCFVLFLRSCSFLFVLKVFFVCLFFLLVSFSSLLLNNSHLLIVSYWGFSRWQPCQSWHLCWALLWIWWYIHARILLRAASSDFIFAALRTTVGCFATFPKDEIFSKSCALLRAPISQLPLDGIKQDESGDGSALVMAQLWWWPFSS